MFDPSHAARRDWALKGGYALELRFERARTTRDLDFTIRAMDVNRAERPGVLLDQLRAAAGVQLPDFFTFIVGEVMSTLEQAPDGGARFPIDARVDGRTFVAFHVDLGVGDQLLEPLEDLVGRDWLGFAGIAPGTARAVSVEQQWAEKLHAYTVPRAGAANSRVRDLFDLAFLLERRQLTPKRTREALRSTFERRETHSLPDGVPTPPADWKTPFAALADECGLTLTVDDAWRCVDAFYLSLGIVEE